MIFSRVIFWEPTISIHKTGLLESLAHCYPDIEFIYIADSDVSIERISQGWSAATCYSFNVIISPSHDFIEKIIIEGGRSTLHIFSGIRHFDVIVHAMKCVRLNNSIFAIYSEPRVVDGYKGKIRVLQSIIEERWIRKNVKFVLAIGQHGPSWFSLVGYPREKIFPFAYFINPPTDHVHSSKNENNKINVFFVGRLCKEKGFDFFLNAASKLDPKKYSISIIGSGDLEYLINTHIDNHSIDISHVKSIPNNKIYDALSKADLLVLPSTTKDDGWGVVISEALLCGVGVIVSDFAGASILVDNKLLGFKLDLISGDSISSCISSIDVEFYSDKYKQYRRDWAHTRLTSSVGGNKLMSIISYIFDCGERPVDFYI